MAKHGAGVPLLLLDVAVGAAAVGLTGLDRCRDEISARAGAAAAPAQQALRRAAGRVPTDRARRLRVQGRARRLAVGTAVHKRLSGTLPRLLDGVLDQLDLTALVERRVDLDRLARRLDVDAVATRLDVDAVATRLDLDAVVARLDLIGLAGQVVDGIDLPRIIRDSTGSVASEGIAGVRVQSADADQAVAHFVDRVLRRRVHPVPPPTAPDGVAPRPRPEVLPTEMSVVDGAVP
ncbi:MAG: hypothetical protein ACJ73E_10250 [Mycobacteriales bacterium]